MRRLLTMALLISASPAFAHVSVDGSQHHVAAGFLHPFSGFDHLLAMFAVGLCAAMLGGPMRVAMPVTFASAMIVGFGLAATGFSFMPAHEAMIIASVIAFGLVLVIAKPFPVSVTLAATAVFGAAHGFAHGLEGAATPAFATGFVTATALLHGMGLCGGYVIAKSEKAWLYRVSGGALATAGLAMALV